MYINDVSKALLIGATIGAVSSVDYILFNFIIPNEKYIPYIVTAFFLLATGFALFTYRKFDLHTIWSYRVHILLFLLVFGLQTKGLIPVADPLNCSILMGVFLMCGEICENKKFRIVFNHIDFIVIGIIIAILLSTINGGYASFADFLNRAKIFILFFLIRNFLASKELFYYFLKIVFIVTVVSAIVGIFQELLYVTTHVIFPPVKESDLPNVLQKGFLRIFGFVGIIQEYALILVVVTSMFWGIMLTGKVEQLGWVCDRRKLYFLLITTGIALILTFSTTAYLTFAIVISVSLFIRKPSLLFHFAALFIFAVLVLIVTGYMNDVYKVIEDELFYPGDFSFRLQTYRDSLYLSLKKHPILGVGLGQSYFYAFNYYKWAPHNTLIEIYAEIGILGIILYCALLAVVFLKIIMTTIHIKKRGDKIIAFSLLYGFLAMCIYIQLVPFFTMDSPWFFLAVADSFYNNFIAQSNI